MANRGRQPSRPEIEVRRFKLDEVEAGIKKLKRRIEQVKALDPTTVRYDDERRYAAERDIRSDIIEIFGQNSPEYLANGHPEIWEGPHNFNMHPSECQERFARGIPSTR